MNRFWKHTCRYIRFNVAFPTALSDIPQDDRIRIKESIANTLPKVEEENVKTPENAGESGSKSIIESVKSWFNSKTGDDENGDNNNTTGSSDSTKKEETKTAEEKVQKKRPGKKSHTLYAQRLSNTESEVLKKRIENEERRSKEREANYKRRGRREKIRKKCGNFRFFSGHDDGGNPQCHQQ